MFRCEAAARTRLPPVDRALHPQSAPVQHVRIHHRRADVGMAEEFLDGADVIAAFEQVCGE